MSDMESLTRECSRQRDLWLLAVGAAIADPKLRPKLVGYAPTLVDLVAAVREGSTAAAWQELGKFGLKPANGKTSVEVLFAELERVERARKCRAAVDGINAAAKSGDLAALRERAQEILEVANV